MRRAGKRIAILFHARRPPSVQYLVEILGRFWHDDGHEVVYLHGTERFVPADLLIVHVDLSVVPEPYLEFAARYPIVLNGRVRDVRKSVTSRQLVRPGDGWDGPVIVKSDLNHGGVPERMIGPPWAQRLGHARSVAARVAGRGVPATTRDYRVFDRLDDVPARWLERSDLVVERFLPELEDGLYHVRMYLFLGDRGRCSRIGSTDPVFDATETIASEVVEPHPQVVSWARELGLDYGKLDYTLHDGEPVLLDVNKTVGAVDYLPGETMRAVRRRQADGLYGYL